MLQRHAQNPSAFLALNRETRRFSVSGVDGFVAYREAGRGSFVQLGGVFADPGDQDRILDGFTAMAARQRRRVVAVQLLRVDAEHYANRGFTVNQFGASYGRSSPASASRAAPTCGCATRSPGPAGRASWCPR